MTPESYTRGGGPAFPLVDEGACAVYGGMTLRDWFAGQALSGLLVNGDPGEAAPLAYKFADAMLKTRGTPFAPEEDVLLFAAAPDLLDSLRDVLSLIDRGLLVRDTNMWNLETRSRLVAILSKAEQSVAKAEGK